MDARGAPDPSCCARGRGTFAHCTSLAYTEATVLPALEETFKTKATIQGFHRFYFPHPGCEIEYLNLTASRDPTAKPLASIQKIVRPHHLAEIRLDGLYVRTASEAEREGAASRESGEETSNTSIGSVTADNSVLEFVNENSETPLKFEFHKLQVDSIAAGEPMSYRVRMSISRPGEELVSNGTFGPWQSGEVGKIPLHGSVKLTEAKLDDYPGLGGTLRSAETFSGTLDQVQVIGEATVPDFRLKHPGHAIQLFSYSFLFSLNSRW